MIENNMGVWMGRIYLTAVNLLRITFGLSNQIYSGKNRPTFSFFSFSRTMSLQMVGAITMKLKRIIRERFSFSIPRKASFVYGG